MEPIYSFTLKELLDNEDPNFIHRKEHLAELQDPTILYAYANTIVLEIKSSQYGKQTKKGNATYTNHTKYKVYVLFEDFYTIGKDKDIPFEDAIDYAINFGDVHCRCTCPSQLYHGFSFMGTELKYLYGVPRENRFPYVRNPNLRGTNCKHVDKVIQYLLSHKDIVAQLFAVYYNRLSDEQSIYAVNENGNTITIGRKNSDGDVFFERQLEEEEPMENTEEMNNAPEETEEVVEDNVSEGMETPDDWWAEGEEPEDM